MEKTSERDALASVKSNANSISFEATQVAMNPPALQLKTESKPKDKDSNSELEVANAPFQFDAADPSPPPIQNKINTAPFQFKSKQGKVEPDSSEGPLDVLPYQLAAEGNGNPPEPPSSGSGNDDSKPNNTGLPSQLKSGVENLSGYSLDDVKVHRNSDKPAQLQAHAYAQGTDIHLGPGQEQHLPHEAWHVVQQKQGRVQPTTQLKAFNINDDAGLEKEADMMGAKAMQMKAMSAESSTNNNSNTSSHVFQLVEGELTKTKSKSTKEKKGSTLVGDDDLSARFAALKQNDDGTTTGPDPEVEAAEWNHILAEKEADKASGADLVARLAALKQNEDGTSMGPEPEVEAAEWEQILAEKSADEASGDDLLARFAALKAPSDPAAKERNEELAARLAALRQNEDGTSMGPEPEVEAAEWEQILNLHEAAPNESNAEEQFGPPAVQVEDQAVQKPKAKKKLKASSSSSPNDLMPGIDMQDEIPISASPKRRKKKVRKKKANAHEMQPIANLDVGMEDAVAAPSAPGLPPPNYVKEAKRAKASLSKDGQKELIASNLADAGGLVYGMTNGIGSDIKDDASLTDAQEAIALEPVSLANDAGSLISGVFELGLGAKSFVEQFTADDPNLHKLLKSGVGTLQSGADVAWAVSGLVNTKTDSDSSEIASFATGNLSKQAGVVLSLMDTIKGGVDLCKALFGEDSDQFTSSEKFGMLFAELKNMAGLAKSIAGQVKHIWSQIENVPSGLSDTLPLLDIISAGLTMIMKGVGIVTAAVRYFDSKETQRELAESLAQEHGTSTDMVKNSLKGHEELEAKKVNADSYKSHNDAKIEHYQQDMEKRQAGLEGKNKVSKKYQNYRIRKDQEQLDRRAVKKGKNEGILDDLSKQKELFTEFSGFTSEELNEYGLGKEIQSVNKKMVQRDTALFIAEAPKIAGGIMKLTGVAAAAGAATSGSSTLAKGAIKGRRKIAQVAKDRAGKNEAKGKENKGLFGAVEGNNSMDAKLQKRTKYAMTILRMAADTAAPDVDDMYKEMRAQQLLTNLKNLGVAPGKLLSLNGKPQKQLKMLVEALSKREF